MRTRITMLFLGVGAIVFVGDVGADDIPKALGFTRYESILNHSPFAVATAAAATPMMADFAKDLYVANVARSPDGDWAAIASSTDTNFRKYLTTKQGMDGYTLANIEWSDQVGATKVTISKDGQFATLSFNQALLSSPLPRTGSASVNPAMMPNVNQATDPAVNRIRPAPVPMLPTPPPRTRGVIPRNPLNRQKAMPVPTVPPTVPAEPAIEEPEQ